MTFLFFWQVSKPKPTRSPPPPTIFFYFDKGYSFKTDKHIRASFLTLLDTIGKISEQGNDLTKDRWLDSSFFLGKKNYLLYPKIFNTPKYFNKISFLFFTAFRLNASTGENQYSGDLAERLIHAPTLGSGKASLFLKFKKPTTYVIRVTVLYRQAGSFILDAEKKCWKNYDIDQ